MKRPGEQYRWFRDHEHPWLPGLSFADTRADELLAFVKSKTAAAGSRRPAWVFDLDSTLFCIAPRMRSILFEFLRQHPKPSSLWQRGYEFFRSDTIRYDFEGTFYSIFLKLTGSEFEARAEARAMLAEYVPFWLEHFYHDRHLRFDVPYPGAVDFVRRVRDSGRAIVYMTGRDRPGTGQGTLTSLANAGFEMREDDRLVMKSQRHESDVLFKQRAIAAIGSQYDVELCIDNEPENLVMFAKALPHSEIAFFHSVMSGRLPQESFQKVLGARRAWRVADYSESPGQQ